jgi:hypothetical protein
MGLVAPEDQFRVSASTEPQTVPDWVVHSASWLNGIKDGRLRVAGAADMVTQPLPVGPAPPAGAKGEEGRPIVIDPTQP